MTGATVTSELHQRGTRRSDVKIRGWEQQTCIKEVFDWLHEVYETKRAGQTITFDPLYPRNDLLTEEVVTGVLHAWEFDILQYEIDYSPHYHAEAQGHFNSKEAQYHKQSKSGMDYMRTFLDRNYWDELPFAEQLGIVQGIDEICNRHRMTDQDFEDEARRDKQNEEHHERLLLAQSNAVAYVPTPDDHLAGWNDGIAYG